MHIAIVEPDEVMGHILAFVARRRGHKPFVARSIAELPERLPFSPAASIVALERLDEESLASVGPLRERYPERFGLRVEPPPEEAEGAGGPAP